MSKGFWKKLKKPILVMAPMANVTDMAYRQIVASCGKPDVFWTEFVSVDGLCSRGRERLIKDLRFNSKERPIVAQFFGKDPKKFIEAVKLAKKMKFDGIDINMGCPDKKVIKQGAGADLILNAKLAKKIILTVKKAAGNLPVSVKTRISYSQYDKKEFKKWLENLLLARPDVIIIHGRTKKMMYTGVADWEAIKFGAEIVKNYNQKNKTNILILGNGDVKDLVDAYEKIKASGVDGVMIGRSILSNPWFFNKKNKKITSRDRVKILLKHLALFHKIDGREGDFNSLKKYFKSYLSGFKNAKSLRIKLMATKNIKEARNVIRNYKS
jgi:nifR3 family TIM-barrel protein